LNTDDAVAKFGLLDYTYLNIKKITEQDADSIGKMNIWITNEMIDRDLFESLIKPERLLKSVCCIVVDLSKVLFYKIILFILAMGNNGKLKTMVKYNIRHFF
jgi:hypothetical protein